jgi:hypothetical protein
VSSYAFDDGVRLLLFDPLAVPEEILELAGDREPVVVLTAPWHERDAQTLVERFGAPVFTPPPDTADDLVRKYGLDPKQIPEGWHSSDVEWLLVDGRGEAHVFRAGDRLPIGVEPFPAGRTTTSCSGSSARARSSPAIRWWTSTAGSRSPTKCWSTASRASR